MQKTPHTPQGENFCMGGNREGHKSHLDQITMIILIQGVTTYLLQVVPYPLVHLILMPHLNFDFHNQYDPQD